MIKKIVILGLVCVAFYEVVLYFIIPNRSYPTFYDMRMTKEFIALGFSFLIGMIALYQRGFKRVSNIWIPLFLLFLIFNIYKAPIPPFGPEGLHISGMWNYKAFLHILAYVFMFLGISSTYFTERDKSHIFQAVAWCGVAMAVLMILQRFGADQIFKTHPYSRIGLPKNPSMGGCLGQPTISAPFVVMCIPFTLYCRRWLLGAIMAVSVVLSGSSFAVAGLCVVGASIILINLRKRAILLCVSAAAILLCLGVFIKMNPDFIQSNGRYGVWKDIIGDIQHRKIILTGAGIGAFKYLYAIPRNSGWFSAHNEYLQLLWSCGIIGFGIAFMAVRHAIVHIFKHMSKENNTILCSFLGVGAICFGTFLLQLAAYQFYMVALLGIIYQNGGNHELIR